MNTQVLFSNVQRKYAVIPTDGGDVVLSRIGQTTWVQDPADASPLSVIDAVRCKEKLDKLLGPALDGSIEIREQINEVNRHKKGRYVDSDQYEDGDDTDIA